MQEERSREQTAGSRQQGADSREQGDCSREQEGGSREQGWVREKIYGKEERREKG